MILKDYNLVAFLSMRGVKPIKKDYQGFHIKIEDKALYKSLYSEYKKSFKPFVKEIQNLKRDFL